MRTIRIRLFNINMDINCTEQGLTAAKHFIAMVSVMTFGNVAGNPNWFFQMNDSMYQFYITHEAILDMWGFYIKNFSLIVASLIGILGMIGIRKK